MVVDISGTEMVAFEDCSISRPIVNSQSPGRDEHSVDQTEHAGVTV